ncbi:MAG TPA: hypothetical protein VGB03_06185 [Acidimicrobiales bacterium]
MIPLSFPRRAVAALLAASSLFFTLLVPASPAEARPLRSGPGYWLAASDGGVFAFGRAEFNGGAAGAGLQANVSGIAVRSDGDGYWLVGRDGGVFAFGRAPYKGGAANLPLNKSIVGIAATKAGEGYWLVGSDGGVFAFGDATFHGSVVGGSLNAPVTGIAPTPDGDGYWVVGRDGGVFAFGGAPFHGSLVGLPLRAPIVGVAATPSGNGYWLVAADGGVFAFGDAGFYGSTSHDPLRSPVVGIARSRSGHGYWLAAADGGLFAFGDAGFYGSAAHAGIRGRVVGIAAGIGEHVPAPATQGLSTTFGWDVSWPQCGRMLGNLPKGRHGYAVIGVTRGHLYSVNECLVPEVAWSMENGALGGLYVNTNYPYRTEEPNLAAMFADACRGDDLPCQLYQYGLRGGRQAIVDANAVGVSAPLWWIDVETVNRWSTDVHLNSRVVQGSVDALKEAGIRVGIYSTAYQWGVVTGGMQLPGVPLWIATGGTIADGAPTCDNPAKRFAGGVAYMVQFLHEGLDGNVLCPAGVADAANTFRTPPPPAIPEFGPHPLDGGAH